MVYPFTQTAEPALVVVLVATNCRHHHHMGKGLITLQQCPLRWTVRRALGEVHVPRPPEHVQ
jgi:hypothetical protein